MKMVMDGGLRRETSREVEVEAVADGIGRVLCPECGGRPEEYPSYFPPGAVEQCVHCKGTGFVYINL
jgi:hypothetical protein